MLLLLPLPRPRLACSGQTIDALETDTHSSLSQCGDKLLLYPLYTRLANGMMNYGTASTDKLPPESLSLHLPRSPLCLPACLRVYLSMWLSSCLPLCLSTSDLT